MGVVAGVGRRAERGGAAAQSAALFVVVPAALHGGCGLRRRLSARAARPGIRSRSRGPGERRGAAGSRESAAGSGGEGSGGRGVPAVRGRRGRGWGRGREAGGGGRATVRGSPGPAPLLGPVLAVRRGGARGWAPPGCGPARGWGRPRGAAGPLCSPLSRFFFPPPEAVAPFPGPRPLPVPRPGGSPRGPPAARTRLPIRGRRPPLPAVGLAVLRSVSHKNEDVRAAEKRRSFPRRSGRREALMEP